MHLATAMLNQIQSIVFRKKQENVFSLVRQWLEAVVRHIKYSLSLNQLKHGFLTLDGTGGGGGWNPTSLEIFLKPFWLSARNEFIGEGANRQYAIVCVVLSIVF